MKHIYLFVYYFNVITNLTHCFKQFLPKEEILIGKLLRNLISFFTTLLFMDTMDCGLFIHKYFVNIDLHVLLFIALNLFLLKHCKHNTLL